MPSGAWTWKSFAIALAMVAGCSDFSQHRLGGIRRSSDGEEGPPKAMASLSISNPPAAAPTKPDDNVKQASFVPRRDQASQPPSNPNAAMDNPLRMLYERASQRYAGMDSY